MLIRFFIFLVLISYSIISFSQEENWRLDSRFIKLDIAYTIKKEYPELEPNAKKIYDNAAYYSINPFLIAETYKANPILFRVTLSLGKDSLS